MAFQCLHTLNCQQQHLNQLKEEHLPHQHHALHTSEATTTTNGYYSSSGDSKESHRESVSYSPGKSRALGGFCLSCGRRAQGGNTTASVSPVRQAISNGLIHRVV